MRSRRPYISDSATAASGELVTIFRGMKYLKAFETCAATTGRVQEYSICDYPALRTLPRFLEANLLRICHEIYEFLQYA